MKCFLDMDGVLVDFVSGAMKIHNIPSPYLNPDNYGKWDIDDLSGIPRNKFWGAFDGDFWASLEWTADGMNILALAEKHFGSENICLLSSPQATNQAQCIVGKMAWIEKHLPQYKRAFMIGPKKESCAHSGAVLVDDADHNIANFLLHGGNGIHVPRLWNCKHSKSHTTIDYLDAYMEFYTNESREN